MRTKNLTNVIFKKEIDFSGTIFDGKNKLGLSADFERATFGGDANFGGAIFSGDANFERATFSGDANFVGAIFDDIANFGNATFSGNARFGSATFSGDVAFWSDTFSRNAFFNYSTLSGKANFGSAIFGGNTFFDNATLNGDASFYETQFKGDVSFEFVSFNGVADFIKARFSRDATFLYCSFKSPIFAEAKFDKFVNFRGSKFESLHLRNVDFEKIYLDWYSIKNFQEYSIDDRIFLSLIESYKTRGFFEDADNYYYLFRKMRRTYLTPWRKFFDSALMVFYKYGTKAILGFFLANSRILLFLDLQYLLFGRYMFGYAVLPLEAFNISSSIILSGARIVESPQSYTSGLYFVFAMEKLLGSLFFFLFLVSVGGTIIRYLE